MSSIKSPEFQLSDGYNLLMLKAEEGNFDEIQRILTEIPNIDVNAVNRNGYTALALATKNGHGAIVDVLLNAKANVNMKNNVYSGQSPLFLACWNNYVDIVGLILDNNVEINAIDQRGWTPLMIAAYNGHREVVRHLLEKNADISVKDRFDKKAIDRAKDSKIIRMLEQAASAPQKHNDTREEHKNERQLHSILKNSTSKAEIDHSKSEELETTKIQEPSNIHNITNQSTVYAPARQQGHSTSHIELSQDQLVTPPPRNDFYSPQNISYNSREHNVSSFGYGRNSDAKISTRFNRIRNERQNLSAERSFRASSRSPVKSATFSSRYMKTTPTRTREKSLNLSLSEVKKQSLKEELQKDVSVNVEVLSEKVQELVLQRIALEVPVYTQEFEQNLKKEMNSVFQFRIDNVFKSLHASFNIKVKFCLNKLGYDTSNIDLTPFDDQEAPIASNKLFTSQSPKYNFDKERRAIERDVSKLEKSVSKSKANLTMERSVYSDIGSKDHCCDHTPFAFKVELKNELFDQLGHEVRSTTEHLMDLSTSKVKELVRGETNIVYQRMMAELNKNLDVVEEEFKNKFDTVINQKVNDIIKSLGGTAAAATATNVAGAANSQTSFFQRKMSPEVSPSKKLFASIIRNSAQKSRLNQDLESIPREERHAYTSDFSRDIAKSPESHRSPSQNLGSPTQTEKEFARTKDRIEKLKSSLNFIDENIPKNSNRYQEAPSERQTQSEQKPEPQFNNDILIQEHATTKSKGITWLERPDFAETLKKEYNENIQAAAKLEELKNFYQKKYGTMPNTRIEAENDFLFKKSL